MSYYFKVNHVSIIFNDNLPLAWDGKNKDFTDALEEINDHIKSSAELVMIVYGNYLVGMRSQFHQSIHNDYISRSGQSRSFVIDSIDE